jgi:hypothetical protein
MPRSTLSHESIGSMSDCEDLSQYSDSESVFTDVDSTCSLSLSDQTLLKQAFSGAVHSRKCTAKDWRHEHERQFQFIEDVICPTESDSNQANKSRSYSSRIRGFVKKLTSAGKKSA